MFIGLVDDFEAGKFEEELLGAGILESDGGFHAVACAFYFLDDAQSEAFVLDVLAWLQLAGAAGWRCN